MKCPVCEIVDVKPNVDSLDTDNEIVTYTCPECWTDWQYFFNAADARLTQIVIRDGSTLTWMAENEDTGEQGHRYGWRDGLRTLFEKIEIEVNRAMQPDQPFLPADFSLGADPKHEVYADLKIASININVTFLPPVPDRWAPIKQNLKIVTNDTQPLFGPDGKVI